MTLKPFLYNTGVQWKCAQRVPQEQTMHCGWCLCVSRARAELRCCVCALFLIYCEHPVFLPVVPSSGKSAPENYGYLVISWYGYANASGIIKKLFVFCY